MITYTQHKLNDGSSIYICSIGRANIGEIAQEVDGYYYFWPAGQQRTRGFWSAHILKDLANKLDALNEAWNQRLTRELAACNPPSLEEWTPKTPPKVDVNDEFQGTTD